MTNKKAADSAESSNMYASNATGSAWYQTAEISSENNKYINNFSVWDH